MGLNGRMWREKVKVAKEDCKEGGGGGDRGVGDRVGGGWDS